MYATPVTALVISCAGGLRPALSSTAEALLVYRQQRKCFGRATPPVNANRSSRQLPGPVNPGCDRLVRKAAAHLKVPPARNTAQAMSITLKKVHDCTALERRAKLRPLDANWTRPGGSLGAYSSHTRMTFHGRWQDDGANLRAGRLHRRA